MSRSLHRLAALLATAGCGFGYQTGDRGNLDAGRRDGGARVESGGVDLGVADAGADRPRICITDASCGSTCDTCCSGRCVLTLASTGESYTSAIAVDDTTVYWTSGMGTIMRVAKGGGTAVTLASGQAFPLGIAVDAASVYWVNQGDNPPYTLHGSSGAVVSVPKGGGTPITLASALPEPQRIAVDATSIYWTNQSWTPEGGGSALVVGTVMKMPLGGGTATTLAAHYIATGIAVDATSVYWAAGGDVMSVPLNGGTATSRTSDPERGLAVEISVDATNVYFTTHDGALKSQFGSVLKAPLAGGPPTYLMRGGLVIPSGLASLPLPLLGGATTTHVYWTGGAGVSDVSVVGDVQTTLVAGIARSSAIAIDATSVYFATEPTQVQVGPATFAPVPGTVMKLTPR